MLDLIRYKIALIFARRAEKQMNAGDFKHGMKNLKRSVWIVPPSKDLKEFGERLRATIYDQRDSIAH